MTNSAIENSTLLIVLGKNIGVGSGPENICDSHWQLSVDSRISAIAAGDVWSPGTAILFSGGYTAGEAVQSEAEAMAGYFRNFHDEIPDESVLIEPNSKDTWTNARNVNNTVNLAEYTSINLLSVGYHLKNAATIFKRCGIPVDNTIAAETVLSKRSRHHAKFVGEWHKCSRVRLERTKEFGRYMILHSIDPHGVLVSNLANASRTGRH